MLEKLIFVRLALKLEVRLLLCCACTQMDAVSAEEIIRLLRVEIDWNYLLDLALRHNCLPLLYRSLEAVAPAVVPETIRTELKKHIQVIIQGNLFHARELLHLLGLFKQHGIQVLPYKGSVLAASVYGDLALRPSNDLDILVHERDILQAMDLLISSGYEILRPSMIADEQKSRQSFSVQNLVKNSPWAYQLVLWHRERRVVVELHWRVMPKYIFPNGPEELWEDLEPIFLGAVTVHSFAPENLLWFLCVHGTKHQWERLIWLCDIAELIRAYPNLNWGRVDMQASKLGIERRLYLGLLLANRMLKAPIPKIIDRKITTIPHIKDLAQQVMESIFDGTEESVGFQYLERFHFQLRAMDHMADRGRYLLRFAMGLTQ
jgi:hypothetical protein